jgi:hypothetical protein
MAIQLRTSIEPNEKVIQTLLDQPSVYLVLKMKEITSHRTSSYSFVPAFWH